MVIVRLPGTPSIQSWSRKTCNPLPTASNRLRAVTSTLCSTPFASEHDTLHVRSPTPGNLSVSLFVRQGFPQTTPPLGLDSWLVIQPFAPLPGVNRSSTQKRRQNFPAVNFVAFRVPANPDDPAPRRLFLPPSRPRSCGLANSKELNNENPKIQMIPLIGAFCEPAGIVLDPFCGSGSTLVAAQTKGRRFIGIELDPGHYLTASNRIQPTLGS